MADVDVTLGLNANELHRELADVKSKLSGFASTLTGLGAGFLSGFGVSQIQQAVTSALSYGSTIQDLSEKFGVSAETIQRFGNVAEKSGGSLESVAKAFKFLEINREKALEEPSGKQAEAFAGLGIEISDLESLNAEQIMVKIGESSLNAADLVTVLGKSALDLRTTLAQIADFGFDKTPIVSNEDIARVDQFDDALKTVQQTVKALAVTIVGELIPAVGEAQGFFAKPFEAITRGFDKTPLAEAAAEEDTALAKQIHAQREKQAGEKLPEELAPSPVIEKKEKEKRRFGEADEEEAGPKEVTGKEDRGLFKGELDVIGADLEAKEETQKEAREASEKETARAEKDARDKAAREETAQLKTQRLQEEFARNPAGISLHEYATQGAGRVAALAQQTEREEAIARQRQLVGDIRGATEHQSRAEQLKKSLGLPSKEDQKDAIKKGLDESENLRKIKENTDLLGANR